MNKAKLGVVIPPSMFEDFPNAGALLLWDLLARDRRLPPISGSVPYTADPVLWGHLPKGVFFITALTKTRRGFTCRITLYPSPACTETWLGDLLGLLVENFFPDEPAKKYVYPDRFLFQGEDKVSIIFREDV